MFGKTRALEYFVISMFCQAGCGRLGFDSADAALSFAQLCDFESHVIIENGIAIDDDAGLRLSEAVKVGCESTITRRMVSQDDASAVDADTGRPLVLPNELIVLGGGDGPHHVVRYLLEMDTPLVWSGSAPVTIIERATNRVIARGPTNSSNDYILLQVVMEPISGTIAFSGQGLTGNGTSASALYFEQVISPRIADENTSWIVVQWTDSDGTIGASENDTYTVIESG